MANELKYICVKIFIPLKVKSTIMQTVKIVQAAVLITIVTLGVSCAAGKEYTSKLFAPRIPAAKDSQAVALRFLELDNLEADKENWVTTDIIMGRDTMSKTLALDNLAKVFPATKVAVDTAPKTDQTKTSPVFVEAKPIPAESEPVAKASNPGEVRNKKVRE